MHRTIASSLGRAARSHRHLGRAAATSRFLCPSATPLCAHKPLFRVPARHYSLLDLKRSNVTGETLRRLLTEEQNAVLHKEVAEIEDIRFDLAVLDADKNDIELLRRSLEQLEELFLLVVVGEFNSGKSSFLNALLGQKFLKEGVTPTTSKINILKYGASVNYIPETTETEIVQLPVDWLKEISLVDTPGTNAVIVGHQQLTEHFVPRSDMVLFVTSTDRAFSESERVFLTHIKQWKKKVLVILSKADLVETPAQMTEITSFVATNFSSLLGIDPVIFPVSAKLALKAKLGSPDAQTLATDALWKQSNFGELEKYILTTLDGGQRAKLKMTNPLGVADHVVTQYVANIDVQMAVVKADMQILEHISEQLAVYRKDMLRDFDGQISRIENCLLKMTDRAEQFFDDKLRVTNGIGLMRSSELKAEFVRTVVGDTSRDIDKLVGDVIDWLVDKNYRQWQSISEYLKNRPTLQNDKVIGSIVSGNNGQFLLNRANLIDSIGSATTEAMNSYDKLKESSKLTDEMRSAFFQTAAMEVGAAGIAAIIATSLLDFTGLFGVGALAVMGMGILPYKRSSMKRLMRKRVEELRVRVTGAMENHFTRELENAVAKMRDTIGPYSTFIKSEHEKMEKMQVKFHTHVDNLKSLRSEIEGLFK